MLKKVFAVLTLIMVLSLTGCSIGGSPLTLEGLAQKKNFTVGEFDKSYLLDKQYTYEDGTPISVHFTRVRVEDETVLSDTTLNHSIIITNADTLERTKAAINEALYFELYTDKGSKANLDIRIFLIENSEGQSEIILNSDKFDITLYDYLAIGPIDGANEQRLLYALH